MSALADLRRRTCSRCLRGQHELCTLPTRCAHAACFLDDEPEPEPEPEVELAPRLQLAAPLPELEGDPWLPDGMSWEDPPGLHRGVRSLLDDVVPILRRHPGRWARIRTCDTTSQATSQAHVWRRTYCAPEWEVKASEGSVFVRYLGVNSATTSGHCAIDLRFGHGDQEQAEQGADHQS